MASPCFYGSASPGAKTPEFGDGELSYAYTSPSCAPDPEAVQRAEDFAAFQLEQKLAPYTNYVRLDTNGRYYVLAERIQKIAERARRNNADCPICKCSHRSNDCSCRSRVSDLKMSVSCTPVFRKDPTHKVSVRRHIKHMAFMEGIKQARARGADREEKKFRKAYAAKQAAREAARAAVEAEAVETEVVQAEAM